MADDASNTGGQSNPKPKTKRLKVKVAEREQSTIGFPYFDLETAASVARAILNAGAVAVTREQLAGLMGTTTSSGTFLNKLSATRMFGLISMSQGKVELTDLGSSILDTDERRAKRARAEAFLNVPLFRKVYDDFRGRQLPPRPLPLEHAFVKFGVAQKQKGTARLTFDKSATHAGFFPNGNDRLIEPIIGGGIPRKIPRSQEATDTDGDDEPVQPGPSNRQPETSGLHPFIKGLIDALPEPGTNWTVEGRAKWLQAAANNFDLMYKGDGQITINAKASHAEAKKDD